MGMSSSFVSILLVGLTAGLLSGMFGIGGGMVIVPSLVILIGLNQKTATGTSLVAQVLPVGLLAAAGYYRRGEARIDYGLLLVPGLMLGAWLGQRLTQGISDATLKKIYAGFLVVVAGYYLLISTETGRNWLYGKPEAAKPVE